MVRRERAASEPTPRQQSWESFTEALEEHERHRELYWRVMMMLGPKILLMLSAEDMLETLQAMFDAKVFDTYDRRYRTMEAAANRLQKESKGYLDSLRGTYCEIDLEGISDLHSHDRFPNAHRRDNRRFLW